MTDNIYNMMLAGKHVYSINYLGRDGSDEKRVEIHHTGGVMTITDPKEVRRITSLRHKAIRLCATEAEFRGEDIVKYIIFHLRYD